ncbi:MAG TPA: hypothetical protein VJR47_00920 [Stellaceae bacterium]|nr:hypothetical protein [Stellaceae bacterium]
MRLSLARLALLGAAAAACVAPAHADFYTLDGRFACLDKPDAGCGGPGRAELRLPAEKPAAAAQDATVAIAPAPADPPPPSRPTAPQTKAAASGPYNPVDAIAAAIKRNRVSAEDVATLQRLSQAGNARATELLAWCDFKGLGVARDPVAAYVLYGVAALAGIPKASANQTVIFEYALTSEQRQKVLDMQNELLANP